ncbi:phage tail protein [Terriglobus sp. ADX1]|uniref:phage tail protein n=1 Tax=Terriglobus sp. ADX1 TaxID=2794063 RepID=UPI002FE547B4
MLSCNGELLPPERSLSYVPQDGDDVQAVTLLENSTLRSIAMIGVAALSVAAAATGFGAVLGAAAFQAFGASFSTGMIGVYSAVGTGLVSVGGTLFVSAIASLFQQKPGGSNYGVLGPVATARSGIPIAKGYGTIRTASNIIESWIDIMGNNGDQHDVDDGADTIGRQYINVRCNFGFGPARSISDLRINDQDISNYADVAYCILYGVNDETPVTASDPRWVVINRTNYGTTQNDYPTTDFNTINNNYPKGQRVRAGGPGVVLPGQRTDTQKLTVYVVFPQGVWRLDDSEEIKRAAIDYDVYYRASGSGDSGWIHVPATSNDFTGSTHYYYNIRQTVLRQATIIDGLTPGRYDVKVVKNGSGAVHSALDNFEHESNKWGDQLWVESVQETSYDTLAYPNMIQVCLRIMASDQLAGADLNLTAVIEYGLRSSLPAELAGLPEDTPAVVAYDVLHDPVIGADVADERIDLNFFAQWAALTQTMMDDGDGGTQKLAAFNGVFDQSDQSIWDVLQTIGVMSRASLQRVGTKITGWLDMDDDPVQMFHMGNMLADSYSKTYLNLEDRAQEVSVTFADEDDDYRTRNPLRVIADSDENSTEALKKTDINLLGCTSRVQAWYWAALRLRELETLLRTHTWKSNTQAIRCRTGNIVKLQHDVPQWGYGGRIQQGSTASSIVLEANDYPNPLDDSCNVIVVHPALRRTTVTISSISGNMLTVSGYDGTTPVKRLVQVGIDVAITVVSATVLKADSVSGLSVGFADLWDLDVMETRSVSALKGDVATLESPLSMAPTPLDAGYIYQSTTRQAKLVRIKQIRRMPGEQCQISAVDYDQSTYDIPAPDGLKETPPTGGGGPSAGFAIIGVASSPAQPGIDATITVNVRPDVASTGVVVSVDLTALGHSTPLVLTAGTPQSQYTPFTGNATVDSGIDPGTYNLVATATDDQGHSAIANIPVNVQTQPIIAYITLDLSQVGTRFTVDGFNLINGGSGYTSLSTATLVGNDGDEPYGSKTVACTLTLDSNGSITSITGGSGSSWYGPPDLDIER